MQPVLVRVVSEDATRSLPANGAGAAQIAGLAGSPRAWIREIRTRRRWQCR